MKIALRQPVLPTSARGEAAQRLGVSEEELRRILSGDLAYCEGRTWEDPDFLKEFPEGKFWEHTGAHVLPEDLLIAELELPRDVTKTIEPPITSEEARAIQMLGQQRFLEALQNAGAPAVIQDNTRRMIQLAYDATFPDWKTLNYLMTGATPEAGLHGEPEPEPPLFGPSWGSGAAPLDCAFLGSSLLIQFAYASLLIAADGAVRDAFPTRGLRAVGGDDRHALFVQGGGAASQSGYFDAKGFVRDFENRIWLEGTLPASLSPLVAGTIGDLKWAVVVDISRGMGYPMSRFNTSDMCGHTFNSACGKYVSDGGDFVLEAATGAPVLDIRELEGDLLCFANTPSGWRFIFRELQEDEWDYDEDEEEAEGEPEPLAVRLLNESGQCIQVFGVDELAFNFSPDGGRLAILKTEQVEIRDTSDLKLAAPALDLRPLKEALMLPDESELWSRLAAVYGIPAAIGRPDFFSCSAVASANEILNQIHDRWSDDPSLEAIQSAIDAGCQWSKLPKAIPTLN